MAGDTRKDRIWYRLVMPILWPVTIAQLVLLLLGLVLGGSLHWLMPEATSWGATLWLMIGLVAGTTLNLLIFLMLLRHRVDRLQRRLDSTLDDIEEQVGQRFDLLGMQRPARDEASLTTRVVSAVEAVSQLLHLYDHHRPHGADSLAVRSNQDAPYDESRLRDEIQRLSTALGRARDESRLKSSYLAHIASSLAPVIELVERRELLEQIKDGEELRRRLSDVRLLLENLDDGEAEDSDDVPRSARRILIVDDGPVNLMLARQVLEREGYGVITATSGTEAIELLDTQVVDLILMDIVLPDIDGVEACRRLRALEAASPQRKRSVVIALTANASQQDQERFLQAGMDGFLAKPYRPQTLLEAVDAWLPVDASLSGDSR
ncbi:response regulator [Halomonas huangheensis]|uniref:Response regulatory domain-containing protein n=1 Tax=Halomonas huangheensis TaxID=1178482 RepID=W1N5H0_9GAMM|nr:response regulator [Halomonas huangheensis]ALM51693.1 hypothetical protein AR456_04875 [Halomonas huangheensis]ERL50185.1 hypothetical protein BJB45_03395 [Halomonas huangheensis]